MDFGRLAACLHACLCPLLSVCLTLHKHIAIYCSRCVECSFPEVRPAVRAAPSLQLPAGPPARWFGPWPTQRGPRLVCAQLHSRHAGGRGKPHPRCGRHSSPTQNCPGGCHHQNLDKKLYRFVFFCLVWVGSLGVFLLSWHSCALVNAREGNAVHIFRIFGQLLRIFFYFSNFFSKQSL